MKNFKLFIFFITIGIISICCQNIKKSNSEKAIIDLVNKYPQLKKGREEVLDFYKPIHSVINEKRNMEFQLLTEPDIIGDKQKILLNINSNKEVYAIPFFSNTYYDYWQFPFNNNLNPIQTVNTTFEKELNNFFENLIVKDTLEKARIILDELFISLLQCKKLNENDSTEFQTEVFVGKKGWLPNDNVDSCHIRIQKNWHEIVKNSPKAGDTINVVPRTLFLDKKNGRLYQVNFINNTRYKKLELNIKTYRIDCNQSMFEL